VKISCPSCAAKYSIADEKVQDRLAKIRCRKCSATIVIDGKVSPANVYTTAGDAEEAPGAEQATETSGAAAASGVEYSVDFGEGDQRTLALGDLVTAYNAGQVTAETYIWADGFSDWKMLQDVSEVVDALNAAASAPVAAAAPAPAPAAAPAPAPTPAPAPARAAARPGRGGAADLFGRIESAGSEDEEVATSAPEPQRTSAPLGSSSSSNSSAGTGARNESSVLFSLSALTAGASKPSNAAATASKPGTASREDSGLIDLKALTAAATKSDAGAAPAASPLGGLGGGLGAPPLGVASPLGVAPLGLGSPLGGTTGLATAADLSIPAQGKSKTGMFVGLGLVAVAAAAVAIAFIMKPEPPPPVATPTAVPTAPAPAAAPEPTQAEVTAKPPTTGTAESEEAPDAGAKVAAKTGGGGARKTGGSTSSKKTGGSEPAAAAPAAPAPAKKKSPCGCASGDLQCAMRCAAGG
jgi:predicted Zn finger-like uncharacterized protein